MKIISKLNQMDQIKKTNKWKAKTLNILKNKLWNHWKEKGQKEYNLQQSVTK